MANWLDTVEDACENLTKALKKANDKLEKSSGEVNERDAEYIRNLMSGIKSAKTIKAMEKHKDDYSNDYDPRTGTYMMERGSYRGGNSYGDDMSYARRRDSMGRYTSENGYSRTEAYEDMANDIRRAMPSMPEELKQNARRFLSDLEQHM